MPHPIDIVRLTTAPLPAADVRAEMDAIFYETAPRAPVEATARAAFHDLWLGQYLRHEPHLAHVACLDGRVIGYLVACHVNPATSARFPDLSYFQDFAEACARFPAHVHINLTAAARGHGTGARLIEASVEDASDAGLAGVHVVTSANARNVSFYQRCSFAEIAATSRRGERIVFLGRTTAPPALSQPAR